MGNDIHAQPKERSGNPLGAKPEKPRLDLHGKSVAEIVTMLKSVPIEREHGTDQPQSPSVVPEPAGFTAAPSRMPRVADAPAMAPGIGGPNLALPAHNPKPPILREQRPALGRFGRLSLAMILAAVVAAGIMLVMFPNEIRKRAGDISGTVTPLFEGPSRAQRPPKPARLVVESKKGFANEPLPLGVTLNEASGAETVTLAGLAIGTRLSAGAPLGLTTWEMAARDVAGALVYAPKDFVGTMDAVIDLRSAMGDWLMDSQTLRLEWIQRKEARPAPPPEPTKPQPAPTKPQPAAPTASTIPALDPQDVAEIVRNFLKSGDVASARLLLRQSANAGNAQAALELGMTFDPAFAKKWNVPGLAPDPAQAREWYSRAVKLGSSEAARHLQRLTGAEE